MLTVAQRRLAGVLTCLVDFLVLRVGMVATRQCSEGLVELVRVGVRGYLENLVEIGLPRRLHDSSLLSSSGRSAARWV